MKNFKMWAKQVGIRVLKTMAESAIGYIGGFVLITDVNWQVVISSVALAGLTTILFNISILEEPENKDEP